MRTIKLKRIPGIRCTTYTDIVGGMHMLAWAEYSKGEWRVHSKHATCRGNRWHIAARGKTLLRAIRAFEK